MNARCSPVPVGVSLTVLDVRHRPGTGGQNGFPNFLPSEVGCVEGTQAFQDGGVI